MMTICMYVCMGTFALQIRCGPKPQMALVHTFSSLTTLTVVNGNALRDTSVDYKPEGTNTDFCMLLMGARIMV